MSYFSQALLDTVTATLAGSTYEEQVLWSLDPPAAFRYHRPQG